MSTVQSFDVLVVGAGPAGSAAAWALANAGVRVALLERAHFPREKVCGDFIEPAGLRILAAMGVLAAFGDRLPIERTRAYVGPRLVFQGAVPYYQSSDGLPAHGYVVPRHELDLRLLERAQASGARVFQGCDVRGVTREGQVMVITAGRGEREERFTAPLVVGADGTESIVARSADLRSTDRRHMALSQRAYVEGVEIDGGEATIWFDDDLFPGYGWLFPMAGGRANVGVGILAEACHRHHLNVPAAFAACIGKLRFRHPGCSGVRLVSRPLGGAVKTYGGAGPNRFDGGLLVGDAGGFVDPITGEGITQGMESALIAAESLIAALEAGRFDAASLVGYEEAFRAYFDPSLLFLDLWAAMTRNWHFREFWLRATTRGFEQATKQPDFAATSGAAFGGLDLRPLSVVEQIWSRILAHTLEDGPMGLVAALAGRGSAPLAGDLRAWRRAWEASLSEDATWTFSWLADVARKAARVQSTLWTSAPNPRLAGPPLPNGAVRPSSPEDMFHGRQAAQL